MLCRHWETAPCSIASSLNGFKVKDPHSLEHLSAAVKFSNSPLTFDTCALHNVHFQVSLSSHRLRELLTDELGRDVGEGQRGGCDEPRPELHGGLKCDRGAQETSAQPFWFVNYF